ncbi:MAG TPA: matrixin family metalloprotease [Gemmatimonadaceae bacterium]|nr:matrixin family metalloprotease [Gemmatimonadaceae bacterium]
MKRSDLLPVALLVPVFGFVAVQAIRTQTSHLTAMSQAAVLAPTTSANEKVTTHQPRRTPRTADRVADRGAVSAPAANAAPGRDIEDVRHRLEVGAHGTYIDEILLERDSALARWPDRVANPIRVWIGNGVGLADWDPSFPAKVRSAFDEWTQLGIPVRFTFVVDSSAADVHVNWIDHFDEPISGKTLWARDKNFWIIDANITLALHHNGGEALDPLAMKAITLHEVGHLLGLDHTQDTLDIMTPRVRVRDLSEADRATMLLLYSLPPGSIK